MEMLDYSPYFIIDEFTKKKDKNNEILEIKTPFGKLNDPALKLLDKYGILINVIKEDKLGYVYKVQKK